MAPSTERLTTYQESDCVFHDVENDTNDIDQLVEGWNNWAAIVGRSDYENYLNGNIKFLFEYTCGRRLDGAEIGGIDILGMPNHIPAVLAERKIDGPSRKIWDLSSYDFSGNSCVVSYWGQSTVFARGVDFVDQVEKFVPSSFAVGFEPDDGIKESLTCPMGESVLHGFVKPIRSFMKGELDLPFLPLFVGEGRDNLPVGMVKRRMEAVDSFARNHSDSIYNGFVFFSERGALAGLCICFEDVGEGAIFAEQFVKLHDVFRSPINLESGVVHHERQASKAAQAGKGQKP